MPECWALCRVRTSTITDTKPRKEVVSVGTPVSQLLESAMTMTSAARRSEYSSRKSGRCGEPTSSSPSTKTLMPTPASLLRARMAPRCMTMPDLSSLAPRP